MAYREPPGQATLSPAQLHQHYTIIHLLSCNTALSTVSDLLTDEFIEALKWIAVFRCPLFKNIQEHGSTAEASFNIWRKMTDVVAAPRLRCLIERLFSIRQAIADVERSFSRLRAIDSAQRAAASPGTQEDEFCLVGNAVNFDMYANK